MFDADDKNTFGNYDVLELLPGRSYPSDNFGIAAIDKKFRHGLLESLWSLGAQVRHEMGMEQQTLQPLGVSKSLPPFQRLAPRERVTNSLCGWWQLCKGPVSQEEFWTLQVLVYCRLLYRLEYRESCLKIQSPAGKIEIQKYFAGGEGGNSNISGGEIAVRFRTP